MRISFLHRGGPQMASYRYRAQIPARSLGARVNHLPADVVIFAKPMDGDLGLLLEAKEGGAHVIVDICDDHLANPLYHAMMQCADKVTVATAEMAKRIEGASVVPDCYEFDEREPHCNGSNLLWFGHRVNVQSIDRLDMGDAVRKVSNAPGCIPWSMPTMREEFARADIVLMPATADYKSPNRTLEAIRQGCFVVAEPHPALKDFPIWIGDIKEGIEWAAKNYVKANQMIKEAQAFIRERFSPATQASAWRSVLVELA